ncbi:GtrA family protein [Naasia lichenicola]|uniref:GtrA family protein n=1 Tax=Naasia lichenicola TaxID=2565933 RepID=A0A4S4FK89_9MICO|nr:GtrA family protein [Naasia lichenicola]THG30843.1 GtrA family protein [Naasia lichenicola]
MKRLLRSGLKFLLVGGLSTAIELAAFNLFVLVWRWDPVSAKVVSSLIALVNAYVGNREWAFRHRRGRSRWIELLAFVAVNVACTALGAGLISAGIWLMGPPEPLALNLINLASIAVVVVVRFVLYHFIVFRASAEAPLQSSIAPSLSV